MHQPIRGGLGYDGLQCVLAVSFVLAQRVDLVDDNAGLPWCGREMRAVLVVVQWFLGLKQLLPVPLFKYSIPSRGQGWRSGHDLSSFMVKKGVGVGRGLSEDLRRGRDHR